MNLKKIYDADEERRTRKGGRTESRQNGADKNNITTGVMRDTASYYLQKYPYLKAFGDFNDFEHIEDIWNESLINAFDGIAPDVLAYVTHPKFSKATVSQIFSDLHKAYIQILKDKGGYLTETGFHLSFQFGKNVTGDNIIVKIPLNSNLDSNFVNEFQSYYSQMPDKEKEDMKSKMQKVTEWIQPMMFEYLTQTSKKDKKKYKSAIKSIKKVLNSKKDVVWLVGTLEGNYAISAFVDKNHRNILQTYTDDILQSDTSDLEKFYTHLEDNAGIVKDMVGEYLTSIGIDKKLDTTSDFFSLFCKCLGYSTTGTSIEDSVRIVDALSPQDAVKLSNEVGDWILGGDSKVSTYNEYYKQLKNYSDASIAWDTLKKFAKSGIKATGEALKEGAKKVGEGLKKAGKGLKNFAQKVGSKVAKSMEAKAENIATEAVVEGGVADTKRR